MSPVYNLLIIILRFPAVIVIFPLIFCFIWNTIGVISQSNMEDNMLKDYIDIIQDMLNKKTTNL